MRIGPRIIGFFVAALLVWSFAGVLRADTGELAWAVRAGGEDSDYGWGVAAFEDGFVVTGSFGETATFGPGEANETELTSAGESDIFVARFGEYSLAEVAWWYLPAGGAYDGEGDGTETYILVANPGDAGADIRVLFVDANGPLGPPLERTVGARSRLTVKMSEAGVDNYPVSTIVSVLAPVWAASAENGAPGVFCERSTYVSDPGQQWGAALGSSGIPYAATELHFAEGATHLFEYYIVLLNPDQSQEANVEVRFINAAGQFWTIDGIVIPPLSNYDLFVNNVVGDGQSQLSARIVSDVPIAAEREMFWSTEGEAPEGESSPPAFDAHASVGIPALSETWLFGEGATHIFDYYLLLANFSDQAAAVEVTFSGPGGPIATAERLIPAGRRATIKVNDYVGARGQVSALIQSDRPVYAERSIYWGAAAGEWTAGHSSAGMPGLDPEITAAALRSPADWVVTEGATHIFDHYLLVFNPDGENAVEVTISFLGKEGALADPTYIVGPLSRLTVNVREAVGVVDQVSAVARGSGPIVVDRAMYYSPGDGIGQWRTGHSSLGFPLLGAE